MDAGKRMQMDRLVKELIEQWQKQTLLDPSVSPCGRPGEAEELSVQDAEGLRP